MDATRLLEARTTRIHGRETPKPRRKMQRLKFVFAITLYTFGSIHVLFLRKYIILGYFGGLNGGLVPSLRSTVMILIENSIEVFF